MRKLLSGLMIGLLVMGFLPLLIPASALTNPTVASSAGSASSFANTITLTLPTTKTDSLIVFEWIGFLLATPCTSLLIPADSNTNSWTQVGNCQADQVGGATIAYSVASNSQSGNDTINCNFSGPNTNEESCYAFDISSAGTITLLGSASGYSTTAALASGATASGNSLILQTVGIETYCQSVVGGVGFQQYIPASACFVSGSNAYGMAGGFTLVGNGGGTSQWPVLIGQQAVWSYLVVQVAAATVTTTTTSYTQTIIGWLVPDFTHLNNTLILIMMPLGGLAMMLFIPLLFQKPEEIGDRGVYLGLFGLTVGAAFGDITAGSTAANWIPFADIFIGGLMLFLWWWNSD